MLIEIHSGFQKRVEDFIKEYVSTWDEALENPRVNRLTNGLVLVYEEYVEFLYWHKAYEMYFDYERGGDSDISEYI